jgi:hypothetical protein
MRTGAHQYNTEFKLEVHIAIAGRIAHHGQDLEARRLIKQAGKTLPHAPGLLLSSGDTIVVPGLGFTRSETAQLIMGEVGQLLSTGDLIYTATK